MLMKTNKILLLAVLAVISCNVWAQGPNNSGTYYQSANGKKGAALKTAFFNIIKNHTDIGYDGLIEAYHKADTRADGKLRDWYSNATNYTWDDRNGNNREGAGWNREHSVPQSWFSKSNPMKSDIVHVLPTDCYVNNRRSSYPFGEVGNATYTSNNGYSKLGSCKTSGYSGTVFEPNDEIKGDIARIYFYMVTCYEDRCSSWGHSVFSKANLGFEKWALDMLMRWSKQDPVDEREIARNNAVYNVQRNRNPFVDYPGLEDYVWGNRKDEPFSYDHYAGGGGGPVVTTVAMPVFSPDEGTYYNKVEITLTTATAGATIYYTTNGVDPSEQSNVYDGPFTLTESATVKAIAVKDGVTSYQAQASYVIENSGIGGNGTENDVIELNSALFGGGYSGSITANETESLTGKYHGVTVTYALGSGSTRYCNNEQIRLYPGNTLTISAAQGTLTEIEFVMVDGTPSSELVASGAKLTDAKWKGNAKTVTVSLGGNKKHARIKGVKVKVSNPTGIDGVQESISLDGRRVIYNLRGQRVTNPVKGIYIVDGKKVLIGE